MNFDDVDELNHSDQSSSDNEGISAASPRSYSKSPRTPISHKEKASSGSNTRTSVSLGKDNSFHSPSLNAKSSDELSFSSELDLRKSKATRMSTTSAERQSTNRSLELISGLTNVSHEKPKSLEHKKSPIFKSGKTVKISPKKIGSILTTYSKMLRKRTSTILKPRTPNVSRVTKKFGMTTSKKLKAQKQEQKHRSDVLKKVKYRVASPKIKILKSEYIVFFLNVCVREREGGEGLFVC